RIGFLLPEYRDVWWEIDNSNNLDSVIISIHNIFDDVILPFFEKYTIESNLVELCKDTVYSKKVLSPFNRCLLLILLLKKFKHPIEEAIREFKLISIKEKRESHFED